MDTILKAHVSLSGRLEWPHWQRARLNQILSGLAGKDVEVIVRKRRSKRSLDQNAYIHGVVAPIISAWTGDDIASTKLSLMGECFGWHTVRGRELPIKPHTSDMTTEECSHFIEWVVAWAMQLDPPIVIPFPGEVEP